MDDETVRRLLDELQAERRELQAERREMRETLAGARAQKRTTIAEVFAGYSKIRRADTCWREIRNRLLPLVRRLGSLPTCDLSDQAWAEHVAARKTEDTARNRPPADYTLNIELQRAKEMIDWSVRAGLVDSNPLSHAKPIQTISARETFLTEEQIQELLDKGVARLPSVGARLVMRAFVLCAYDGMMRLGEVRQLRRDRLGRDGAVELSARQTKSRRRRFVPVTPRMLRAIEAIPTALGSPFVFANPDTGNPYGITTIESWFRAACIDSGVDKYAVEGEKVLIHTLRHSGATAADARGASPLAIKEALGHASLATTEKYLHRHRESSARDLARLMAAGAEAERRGPQRSDPHIDSPSTPKAKRG